MDDLTFFDDLNFNGVISAGLGATSDTVTGIPDKIIVGSNVSATIAVASFLSVVRTIGGVSPELERIGVAAVVFIVRGGYLDRSSYCLNVDPPATLDYPADMPVDRCKSICSEEGMMEKAVSLVVATKVNFFNMNHHVGQGRLQGYAKKYVQSIGIPVSNDIDGNVRALWLIGHLASTAKIFHALGLRYARVPNDWKPTIPIIVSEDVRMRLSSAPSGVARFALCAAVIKRIIGSVFADFLPALRDAQWILDVAEEIKKAPLAFHTSRFVIANTYVNTLPRVSDEAFEYVCAFIHSALGNSTLARSPGLLPASDVRGHDVFVNTISVITTVPTVTVDPATVAQRVRANANNSVATQGLDLHRESTPLADLVFRGKFAADFAHGSEFESSDSSDYVSGNDSDEDGTD